MKEIRNRFRIIATATYLPRTCVSSDDLDHKLGRPAGWSQEKSRVLKRHFASPDETFSFMGAKAVLSALDQANLTIDQIDFLISASATCEQPLPYQASAIHKALGLGSSGIPCLDVSTTCLSFVSALEVASMYLALGKYRRIAIVSSEIASAGLNWQDSETAPLFGDGAAAAILEATPESRVGLIASRLETYSDGYEFCRVRAGASRLNFRNQPESDEAYMFAMDGRKAFKLASDKIENFVALLFANTGLTLNDVDVIVPHQASSLALHHMRQRLGIPDHKLIDILENHGNQVAASIPTALDHAFKSDRLKSGSTALLIGTSAGISIGAALLRI